MRCLIGKATNIKQSIETERIDASEANVDHRVKYSKTGYQLVFVMAWIKGANMHVKQSVTERCMTRYVPEFRKHFNGSLPKAIRSSTFEATPITQIITNGKLLYLNSKFDPSVLLFAIITRSETSNIEIKKFRREHKLKLFKALKIHEVLKNIYNWTITL